MLPTPSKSHYTFNLRDLSKVFQGIMMGASSCFANKESLVRVWLHELARVFRDRLIDDTDKTWFNSVCAEMVQSRLSTLRVAVVNHVSSCTDRCGCPLRTCAGLDWTPANFSDILMGDYLTKEPRLYKLVDDPAKVRPHDMLLRVLSRLTRACLLGCSLARCSTIIWTSTMCPFPTRCILCFSRMPSRTSRGFRVSFASHAATRYLSASAAPAGSRSRGWLLSLLSFSCQRLRSLAFMV
jgi:hypothetical protein